ncbi:MAG: hypothetical protein EBR34_02880 [Sphingomonadaceae bacterium]|nr:hypothetical protein [Sphingomonadaceae bacterium]
MTIRPSLAATLEALEPAINLARHPWWILGSAAAALHGADLDEIRDVDVLLDRRDCPAVFEQLDLAVVAGQGDGQFSSAVFQRWNQAALPVELFADFKLHRGGAWHPVLPQTRMAAQAGEVTVYIPERSELIAMLRQFGRPKDLLRIAALSPSGPSPSRSGSA